MIKKHLSALGLSFGFSLSVFATDLTQVDQVVNEMKAQTQFPYGTAIAVVKGKEVIYQQYFGYSDIANQQKVTADTPFYIASITKPYFALAMLLKEQQGQINESTSMQALFPDSRFTHFDASKVTVKHLLSHTMGINNSPLAMIAAYRGGHTAQERNQLVVNSSPNTDAPLGTFDYSNVGYNILSVWSEKADKTPWQKMLAEQVFTPLNLTRTSAFMSDAEHNNWSVAKPYSIAQSTTMPLYLSKQDDTMQAAGGMITSTKDMATFLIAQLNQGKVDGKQVFPANVIEKSHQPVASLDKKYGEFKRDHYAWGWYIGPYQGQTLYHHFGGYPGTHSHLSFMPEKGIGIVILNNEDMLSSKFTGIIAKQIYSTLLGDEKASENARVASDKLRKNLSKLMAHMEKSRCAIAQRQWQLSLEKSNYAGTYSNDLMGQVTIEHLENDALNVSWGHLKNRATPYTKPETIRVELIPNRGEVIRFNHTNGKIESLTYNKLTFIKNS